MSKGMAPIDGIRAEILQFVYPEICTHLFIIYQACLNLCYFPSAWKIATVAIIPKPDRADYTLPTSYRPISLLPVLGKLFETIINRRLQYLAITDSWFYLVNLVLSLGNQLQLLYTLLSAQSNMVLLIEHIQVVLCSTLKEHLIMRTTQPLL